MNITFIGNSHLGHAAKAARSLLRDADGTGARFHIERTYGTERLRIAGGGTEPEVLGNVPVVEADVEVDTDAADAFAVVGMNFSVINLIEKTVKHRRDTFRGKLPVSILSEPLYGRYLDAVFDATKMVRTVRALRRRTDKPIWVLPQAMPLHWALQREGKRFDDVRAVVDAGETERTLADFERQLARLEADGIGVVRQPAETLAAPMFTRTEFGLANPADAAEDSLYARGDFYHMNADYGRAHMGALLRDRLGLDV